MRRLKIYRLILLFTACFVFLTTAVGQTAQLTGRIRDAGGAVVPGAQITLSNQANGFKRDTVTDDEGYYTLPLLQPGSYQLTVRKDGFKPVRLLHRARRKDLSLRSARRHRHQWAG